MQFMVVQLISYLYMISPRYSKDSGTAKNTM